MDPLSDLLSLLKPQSYMFRGLEAGGEWSIQFPANEGIRCYAILSGACWLVIDGTCETIQLTDGDCVLLTRNQSFRMASHIDLTPIDGVALFGAARQGGVAICNGGGNLTGIGGYFAMPGKHASALLSLLPPVVHLRKESTKTALRISMEMIMQELRDPQPGGFLVAQHIAQMMLVLALRLHLSDSKRAGPGVGWLFALADRQMGAAINAIHDNPAQPWTLQALAQRACMSRSSFAQKFKETVGTSPMEYLIRWRMLLAENKLATSRDSIYDIAVSLGYESESSFSTAFKRVMGCAPRQYSRTLKVVADSPQQP